MASRLTRLIGLRSSSRKAHVLYAPTVMRLLLLSTPVGPLGSGMGGGVELTVANLARVLTDLGHRVAVAAPVGSSLHSSAQAGDLIELIQIPGGWQTTAQTQDRLAPTIVSETLANAWDYARQAQAQYDLLVNFAYDWLPFYLTPFFTTPVAHFVSMGSLNDRLDDAILQLSTHAPGTLGAYTRAQANTFAKTPAEHWQILGSAIDIEQYEYCDRPENHLAWVGRISPEKGLEDAVAAAIEAERSLKIFGKIEDAAYWQHIQQHFIQSAPIEYCGFLPTAQLQKALGRAQALLMTPHWIEAFGMVAIEALACGVPVIAYNQGGPVEIVQQGRTGWLVEPQGVDELVGAIAKINLIDRRWCRLQAETQYSLSAWGKGFEQWFYQIISGRMIG